ncbi:MAG: Gfo/Idh/MocA family protein [Armatimonadota bacterium]
MPEKAIVVGAGGISDAWFPPLIAEQLEIAAVVDLRLEAARAKVAQYHLDADVAADLASALTKAKPDFVLDLTVPEAHHEVTCMALEAGCHVIGEKPMAPSMEEARGMVRTSERTGKLYMVDQSRRWDPRHEAVRRALAVGTVGDVTTINCDFYLGAHFGGFRDEMDHPLILDMAIHHFDLARMMAGADPVAVYAKEFNPKGSWYKGDVAASCVFEMADGIIFTYRGSWCAEGLHTSWNGDWRFVGSEGTLVYEHDNDPKAQVVAGDTGFHRPLKDVPVPAPEMEATGMHGALREMLRFLRTGELPQTECHDNIKSLAMCFAAIESARSGRRVRVEA